MMLIIVIFSRFFPFQCHYSVLDVCISFVSLYSPLLWAVVIVSAVVAFLTLGAHVFIVHMLCFLCFLHCGCDVLTK